MATKREPGGSARDASERGRSTRKTSEAEPRPVRKRAARRGSGQKVIVIEEKRHSTGLWVLGGIVITLLVVVGALLIYDIATQSSPAQQGQAPDLAQLETRAAQSPNDIAAQLTLGHAYIDNGGAQQDPAARGQSYVKARDTYLKALRLQANNADALTHLGISYYQLGETDKALVEYDKALALNPSYAHALFDKANAQRYGKNDYAGAIKTWESFLKLVPADSADAQNVKGYIEETKRLATAGSKGPQPQQPTP